MELYYRNKLSLLFHQVKIKRVGLYSNELIISTYIIQYIGCIGCIKRTYIKYDNSYIGKYFPTYVAMWGHYCIIC